MQQPHPKYKIQKGDTIHSITELFCVEEDVWKRYHNNMCPLTEAIRDALPLDLESIYLLPKLWEKAVILRTIPTEKHTTLIQHNSNTELVSLTNWTIYPKLNSLNHAYWFRLIDEDEKSKTEVRYKILIRFIQEETDETSLLLINRISDVYINDELPNLCMDELAYETGKVFYPMVVELDKEAKWIALRNYEQIKKKWIDTIRPYVRLRYAGDITDKYLTQMDKVIDSKERIEEIFKNDLFFKFYFNTVYQNYSSQFEDEKSMNFPVGNSAPLLFNVKSKLNRNLTPEGYKEITQYGIGLNPLDTDPDEFPENELNNYSARILLEAKTNLSREVDAEWDLGEDQRKIKLILFPSRHQSEDKFDFVVDKVNKNKKRK